MKMRHYSLFRKPYKALDSSAVWNDLRNDVQEPFYFIPDTFEKYEAYYPVAKLSPVAQWMVNEANDNHLTTLFSIGVGKGYLEYEIKKFSTLKVIASDYTESILKLKSFHFFDDAVRLDIVNDSVVNMVGKLVIFSRIDTEFTDEQLGMIFKKFHQANIAHICFVPGDLISVKSVLANCKIVARGILTGRKITFCGYYRDVALLKKIFMPYYHVKVTTVGNKKVFKLIHKDIVNV